MACMYQGQKFRVRKLTKPTCCGVVQRHCLAMNRIPARALMFACLCVYLISRIIMKPIAGLSTAENCNGVHRFILHREHSSKSGLSKDKLRRRNLTPTNYIEIILRILFNRFN